MATKKVADKITTQPETPDVELKPGEEISDKQLEELTDFSDVEQDPVYKVLDLLYGVVNDGAVGELRKYILDVVHTMTRSEAEQFQLKLQRLKSAAEAAVQSATEAYSTLK